ncbi:hypothetical protein [Streptomyces sp. NBC_01615]|uniref:hypothetical protein n=1 Tax=Streptomyces sp. NBC_01615 TaxID=2975898 RepID=UPI00386CC4A5
MGQASGASRGYGKASQANDTSGAERPHRGHLGEQPSWERSDDPGHTHDPNEVTVQLDGTGRQLDDRLVQQAKGAPGAQEGGSDGPVFVDESGRRSRRFRRLGILVGIACAVYAVVIVATLLSGNSNAPWLPVPGQQDDQPAGKVDSSPLPAEPVSPSGTGRASPGASATGGDGTTRSPGASTTPGASGSAATPGKSTGPEPSASATTKPNPGTSTTKDPAPDPDPTDPVVNPPDPSPSGSGATTADPSGSPVTDGSGSGTVADGAASLVEQASLEPERPITTSFSSSSSYASSSYASSSYASSSDSSSAGSATSGSSSSYPESIL